MAISQYSGRTLEELWMVTQDGSPILRGQTKAEAEAMAKRLGDGFAKKRAGTQIHMPHIEIAYDHQAMKRRDDLYTEFKEYRRG